MRFRDKLAEQRSISKSLQTADSLKNEEYNKGVNALLKDVWKHPADRTGYSQSRLSFAPRQTPPRRQRVDQQSVSPEQKENQHVRNNDEKMFLFADRIASTLAQQTALNRDSTKAMMIAFSAAQDKLNKIIVLVSLVDKSGLRIIRCHI